ncbi:3-deoxy-D-manno-octulosonic acid transferase [Paludibacter sp. 221]|uniref:3-deoxy-D-manno-octulosonic acid transferase n=1 Tax=Paludibacter sp. 221 TaxID=2302939 RepID=UPI0013D37748|nr:glycosyltransferase N-terminal domain-containing protein [Paludibacter sp. 221]NDV47080.1 3-deoxy-D-manno-octulosonic acid transferase [Paludibacter sp. 221]
MKTLYTIGIYIYGALTALAAVFNKKARKLFFGQRKALSVLKQKASPNKQYIWIHAASLGEFEQGRPVIEAIKAENPEKSILLTFYSPSGYEVKKDYKGADIVSYLPLDTPRATRNFLNTVNISQAIFIKYDFWPNFLFALRKAGIPTYIVSAIFRPGQAFFKTYGKWYLNLLKTFNHIFVQNNTSAELLKEYGITQVTVTGDTRFDRVAAQAKLAKEFPLIEQFIDGKPVIVAGSTWQKDEALLTCYLNKHKDVKLILVPHEVYKAHLYDIFKMLKGDYIRYSEATTTSIKTSNCLVLDTVGMLSSVYRYATVAYIGGGFGAGIHNILEAAVYSVPVVFGPNYQKFREAKQLIKLGGGFSICNYSELESTLSALLKNNKTAGKIAGDYVRNNTGATREIIKHME